VQVAPWDLLRESSRSTLALVTTPASPTVLRKRLGMLLREARVRRGLNQDDVATALEVDRTTIGRIENGQAKVKVLVLKAWLNVLDIHDPELCQELEQLARDADKAGWWTGQAGSIRSSYATYVGFESGAVEVLDFQTVVVPGLLQTEAYATALFSTVVPGLSGEDIAARVQVRLKRQERVEDATLRVTVVIDESVLYRTIGGFDVWRGQMQRLATLAARPNVRMQILPYDTPAHPGALGSFVVLRFDNDPMIAYIESAAGDLFLDGQPAQNYSATFNALAVAALPAEMSRKRILEVLDQRG